MPSRYCRSTRRSGRTRSAEKSSTSGSTCGFAWPIAAISSALKRLSAMTTPAAPAKDFACCRPRSSRCAVCSCTPRKNSGGVMLW